MLSFEQINELIRTVGLSAVNELELEADGLRLVISKGSRPEAAAVHAAPSPSLPPSPIAAPGEPFVAPAAPALAEKASPAVPSDTDRLHRIVSPMVGTFYRASSPDKPPYVNVGDSVGEKSVVCILEAMKLMNELEAECSGEIVDILAENGQLVEYGQPLFLVKTR